MTDVERQTKEDKVSIFYLFLLLILAIFLLFYTFHLEKEIENKNFQNNLNQNNLSNFNCSEDDFKCNPYGLKKRNG